MNEAENKNSLGNLSQVKICNSSLVRSMRDFTTFIIDWVCLLPRLISPNVSLPHFLSMMRIRLIRKFLIWCFFLLVVSCRLNFYYSSSHPDFKLMEKSYVIDKSSNVECRCLNWMNELHGSLKCDGQTCERVCRGLGNIKCDYYKCSFSTQHPIFANHLKERVIKPFSTFPILFLSVRWKGKRKIKCFLFIGKKKVV